MALREHVSASERIDKRHVHKLHMTDRRGHTRIVVANTEGVLHDARDVTVISVGIDLVVLCSEPVAVGEAWTIEIVVDGYVDRIAVRVKESELIVASGAIRYRIDLTREVPIDVDIGRQKTEWEIDRTIRLVKRRQDSPD